MKVDVTTLAAETDGSVDLPEAIFNLEPRADVLHRVVRYQLARRQQGTHSTKTRSMTSFSRRKIFRQKGTGNARHGDRNAPIFRSGGIYKGPTPRSHAHKLNRKFRKLGLRHALSAKFRAGETVILDQARLDAPKTGELAKAINRLGWQKTLVVDGAEIDSNFAMAARNFGGLDIVPGGGANVYDILQSKTLVITRAGLDALKERLA